MSSLLILIGVLIGLVLAGLILSLVKADLIPDLNIQKNLDRDLIVKYSYTRGIEKATQDHIAYALREYGTFNGPKAEMFIKHPALKHYYHRYWNLVSHLSAGFRGRIN